MRVEFLRGLKYTYTFISNITLISNENIYTFIGKKRQESFTHFFSKLSVHINDAHAFVRFANQKMINVMISDH